MRPSDRCFGRYSPGISNRAANAGLLLLLGCAPGGEPDTTLATWKIAGDKVQGLSPRVLRYAHPEPDNSLITVIAKPTDDRATVRVCARSFDSTVESCSSSPGTFDVSDAPVITATVTSEGKQRTYEAVLIPSNLPPVRIETLGDATEGAWFLGVFGPKNTGLILDSDGIPLWYEQSGFGYLDLRASPDGSVTYVQRSETMGPRIGFQLNPDFSLRRTWEAVPLSTG